MTTKAKAEINQVTNGGDVPTEANIFDRPTETENERQARREHEREQRLKAIAFMEIPYTQSRKLIGANFDILDAVRKTINGESNVSFIVRLNADLPGVGKRGDKVSFSKKLNTFTETYISYFELFDADEVAAPMEGYTVVELSEGGQAGNKPVVLRKL